MRKPVKRNLTPISDSVENMSDSSPVIDPGAPPNRSNPFVFQPCRQHIPGEACPNPETAKTDIAFQKHLPVCR